MEDPAEALDILLEELKRQKSLGVRRVSVSDASLAALKAMVGPAQDAPAASVRPVARPVPTPAASAVSSPVVAPVRPSAPVPVPKPAPAAATPPIPDAPVFALPSGTKAERLQALRVLVDACAETKKHLAKR